MNTSILLRDRVNLFHPVESTGASLRNRKVTYPDTPDVSNESASVQQSGRVGAREAIERQRTNLFFNRPTTAYFAPDTDVREQTKVVVTVRDGVTLSASEQARETYFVEEVKASPGRKVMLQAALSTKLQ